MNFVIYSGNDPQFLLNLPVTCGKLSNRMHSAVCLSVNDTDPLKDALFKAESIGGCSARKRVLLANCPRGEPPYGCGNYAVNDKQ